ncbi:MAG: hypothetical protein ABJB47_08175 [Actinomycetota bacterium]
MKTVTTRLLATAASGAALALTLGAGAASASVPINGPAGTQAVTQLRNVQIFGGNGVWATGSVGRNLTVTNEGVVSSAFCAGNSPCQEFSATVDDGQIGAMNSGNRGGQPRFNASPGSFFTIPGAFTPNQFGLNAGRTINRRVFGSFTGEIHYAAFYTTSFAGPLGRRVPAHLNGTGPADWPSLEWPPGTTFYSLNPTSVDYAFDTTIGQQEWIATSRNNFGQSPFAGNITG